jgi:hypothetical protein
MKKAIFLLVMALSVTTLFNSCVKDTDDRDKFVASWNINETYTITGWGTDTDTYTITITKSSTNTNGIIISNFGGVGFTVEATVSGSTMTISDSVTDSGDVYSVTGSGSASGSTLSMNYNIGGYWSGTCTGSKM